MNTRIKICHVITSLGIGGAERMLLKLASGINRERFDTEVICLTDRGAVGDALSDLGMDVRYLGMSRGIPDPRGLVRLVTELRTSMPDLIQTWMYHADLIGGLAGIMAGRIPVVWNIRNSTLDRSRSKKTTIATVRVCALFSNVLCKMIVSCAESAARLHADLGYPRDKMMTIPNGFDVTEFRPNINEKNAVRRELGIPENCTVVGLVARFDDQKNHPGFFEVAKRLIDEIDDLKFIFCGEGVTWDNVKFRECAMEGEITEASYFLGPRKDIARITASMDIACSASGYGEAFSNSIGEAMACAVPCVVTDVGDSGLIVGDTGFVVPPENKDALYTAIKRMVDLGVGGRRELGTLARQRVIENYSLAKIVCTYEDLYLSVVGDERKI